MIWSPDDVFSAGANLESLMPVFMKSGAKGIAPEVKKLQDLMLRLRYAQVPVVSAMRGIALGGGCELALYSARRVAHMETYVGLVEVGVGLVPAGGGLAAIARRAAEAAAAAPGTDLLAFIRGAVHGRRDGQGRHQRDSKAGSSATCSTSDVIVPHKDELLTVALAQAKAMADSGWRAPHKRLVPGGRPQRRSPPSRRSWSTCATAASSARTTSTSPA